jgi:hypothetical protein
VEIFFYYYSICFDVLRREVEPGGFRNLLQPSRFSNVAAVAEKGRKTGAYIKGAVLSASPQDRRCFKKPQ